MHPLAIIPATKRSYAEVAASPSPLDSAEWVYVRRGPAGTPLADKYEGPFQMLARGPKFFKLKMGEREDTVSRDRLKPHLAAVDPILVKVFLFRFLHKSTVFDGV